MLTALTEEQKALITVVRDEWMAKLFDPKKRLKLDRDKATKQIKWLYKFCKKDEPIVWFMDSPLGCQIAANFLRNVNTKFSRNISENISENIQENIGRNIRGNIEENIWENIWENIQENIGRNIRVNIWENIRVNIWENIRGNIGRNIRVNIWENIRKNTWENTWENIGENIGESNLTFEQFGRYIHPGMYGWCGYVDYFRRINAIQTDEAFENYIELLESGIYNTIELGGICIICPLPAVLHTTQSGGMMRLHCETGPAIQWPDGYEEHYLWGVHFPKTLFKKVTSKKVSAKTIFGLKNIDQRMAALKIFGTERLIESAKALPLDKSARGNELFVIPKEEGLFNNNEYFLKYMCPSTGRIYVKPVPPDVGSKHDADFAQASTFRVPVVTNGKIEFRPWTKEEYRMLSLES